jgi:hypothetical protein
MKIRYIIKVLFTFIMLLSAYHNSPAQKLTSHPGNKISNKYYQYLVGFKEDNTFLIASKQNISQDISSGVNIGHLHWEKKNEASLLRYNSSFELTLQSDLAFTSKPEIYFGAFINKDLLQFVYSGMVEKKYTCIVDQFDANGRFIGTKDIGPGLTNYQGPADIIKYFHTDDFFINCIIVKDQIIFFDKNLKELWSENISADKILDAEFSQEDGVLFIAGMKDTSCLLYKYDPINKSKAQNTISPGTGVLKDISIHFYPEKNELILLSLYQSNEKTIDFPVKGIRINRINTATLAGKKENTYNITTPDLLEMSKKTSMDKFAGPNEINVAGLNVLNEDEIAVAVEKRYKVEIRPTGLPEYEVHYEDILLIKCHSNGKSSEQVIKRNVSDLLKYEHYLPSKMYCFNNQLSLLFYDNENGKGVHLTLNRLNNDLKITASEKIDTYALNHTFLSLSNSTLVSPGRYFIPASGRSIFASAYLDLK